MKSRFIGWLVVCLVIPTVLLAQPAEKTQIVGVVGSEDGADWAGPACVAEPRDVWW